MTLSLFFIHLLKRAWKNGRVKWNIFKKSSSNFNFGQDSSRKSGFARPNSSKLVLLEISQDRSFQQLWLLDFKDGPKNFTTSKTNVLRQEWTFLDFYLLLSEQYLSLMYQGFWIRLWTVTSLFSSMSRAVGRCLLRKITK